MRRRRPPPPRPAAPPTLCGPRAPLTPWSARPAADEGINPTTGLPVLASDGKGAPVPKSGLLVRLLMSDKAKRIGCLKNGAEDIKKHKWFRGLNWAALYNKQMPAPLDVPQLSGDDDHHYFPVYPDSIEESGPQLDEDKRALFSLWQ